MQVQKAMCKLYVSLCEPRKNDTSQFSMDWVTGEENGAVMNALICCY